MDERIDESVLWWFGHAERMEKDSVAKKVYVEECPGSRSMDRLQKTKEKRVGCWTSKENGA